MVAAAIVGAGIGTALIGSEASSNAADVQAGAANNASNEQLAMFNQNQANLAPYRSLGTASIPSLIAAMGYTPQYDSSGNLIGMTQGNQSPSGGVSPNIGPGTSSGTSTNPLNQTFSYSAPDLTSRMDQTFSFDPSDLQNYPGYQFTLQQGMQGVDNSAAAKGLGVSGADIRGAADYATGLAQQTYGNAYNQAQNAFSTNLNAAQSAYQTGYNAAQGTFQTNYNAAANNANRLYSLMNAGQTSAATTANLGASAAANAGQLSTSGAAAQAAGIVGSANAITGSVNSGFNAYMQNNLINAYSANNALMNGMNGGAYSGSTTPNYAGADSSYIG